MDETASLSPIKEVYNNNTNHSVSIYGRHCLTVLRSKGRWAIVKMGLVSQLLKMDMVSVLGQLKVKSTKPCISAYELMTQQHIRSV